MTNEWIKWSGGDCPVPKGTLIDVKYRDGAENYHVKALMNGKSAGGTEDRVAAAWEVPICKGGADIIAWRLHQAEPSQLHERTFIPATREGIMAFFRSENFDLLGLTEDDRLEIFLNILQGQDDITENLLHDLCNNYITSLGEIPKYVPEPKHDLELDVALFEKAFSEGFGTSSEDVAESVANFKSGFPYRNDCIIDAFCTVVAYLREIQKKETPDGVKEHSLETVQKAAKDLDRVVFLEQHGWTFAWCVSHWHLTNKAQNLRVVRVSFNEAVAAAYKYEVLSCPNN